MTMPLMCRCYCMLLLSIWCDCCGGVVIQCWLMWWCCGWLLMLWFDIVLLLLMMMMMMMMILVFRKCQIMRSSFCNERSSFCILYVEMYTSWYAKRRLLKLVILCGEVFFLHNMDWWVAVVKKGGCASTVKMVTKRRPKMWAKGLLFALSYVEMYQTHAVALALICTPCLHCVFQTQTCAPSHHSYFLPYCISHNVHWNFL